jgi:hypothetical protein
MSDIYDDEQSEYRDKRGNFVRLAESRTTSCLEKLRILSNLSNRHLYEYTDEDIQQIFGAIEEEVRVARQRFVTSQRKKPDFRLNQGS